MTGGDARHVAETAGGEPEQCAVLLLVRGRDIHQRRRSQLRNMTHQCDEQIVMVGRDAHDLGPERLQHRAQLGVRLGLRRRRRCQHPCRADEQCGVGTVDAFLFGASHRMAADEPMSYVRPRALHRRDDRTLDRADIRDDRDAGVQRGNRDVDHLTDRNREHGDVG